MCQHESIGSNDQVRGALSDQLVGSDDMRQQELLTQEAVVQQDVYIVFQMYAKSNRCMWHIAWQQHMTPLHALSVDPLPCWALQTRNVTA